MPVSSRPRRPSSPLISLFIPLLLIVAGCDVVDSREDDEVFAGQVLVGNQGDFVAGNGSITRYDPATGAASTALRDLESIVQSIDIHDGRLYVTANTGGRVDVFDAQTLSRIGSVEALVSPRYMAFSDEHLFVTNLYGAPGAFDGGSVAVVDLESLEVEHEVEVGDNPEGIVRVGSRLFVANSGFGSGRTVSVIDIPTMSVSHTLDVDCDGPRSLIADPEGDVFVFCTGQTLYDEQWEEVGATDGAIRVIDSASLSIKHRISVEGRMMSAEFGQDAFLDEENGRIFALRRNSDETYSALVINTTSDSVVEVLGPFDGRIGAIAFDAVEDLLYIGRIDGFTRSGGVTLYDLDGEPSRSFATGVAPTSIRITTR